jgi:hypothetical protein
VVRADTCRVEAFGVESDAGDGGGQCTRFAYAFSACEL